MKRFRAAKKLDALDTRVDMLEAARRALEVQAFGAELNPAERRSRYFAIEDMALRRKAIGIERDLCEQRQQQRSAGIEYWTTVRAETRAKLEDLRSESPTAGWRRDIWLDALTLLWILGGAGWLAAGSPGALAGKAVTAVGSWFIVRSRQGSRPGLSWSVVDTYDWGLGQKRYIRQRVINALIFPFGALGTLTEVLRTTKQQIPNAVEMITHLQVNWAPV